METRGTTLERSHCVEGPALEAHCRRVDALAVELARRLRWEEARQIALRESVKSHHVCFPDPRFLQRVIHGVWGGESGGSPSTPPKTTREMASLLELCCLFVERWEYSHFEPVTFDQVVEELSCLAADGFFEQSHVLALARVPSASFSELQQIIHRLPVFPIAAIKAMHLAADPFASMARLEEVVATDAVLAGEILRAANSPAFSPAMPIRSIRQSALWIGMPTCCRVITAAALRPVFRAPNATALWTHSLEIARLSESVARLSGKVPPEQAFLTGLVHDAGRLALAGLPARLVARHTEMVQAEVETVFADVMTCGFDHMAIGGEILRHWHMPVDMIDAVTHHHQPENGSTPLASVLYLAEYWSGSQEDLPSLPRLRFAFDQLGLQPKDTLLLNAYAAPELKTLA